MNLRTRMIFYLISAGAVLLLITVLGMALQESAVAVDFKEKNLAPCLSHFFGTDWMGRDMLKRTAAGLSTSIVIGVLAAAVSALMGILLGTAAAMLGRKADLAVSWLIDLAMGVPHMVLLLLISFALGRGELGVTVGVALTHWTGMARIIRGEVLQLKESHFISVAKKLGQSRLHIAVKHMLPHVFPQFLVGLILLFPHAILHEASITFLGFGLSPERPAIGMILSESMRYLTSGMWWLAFFPGAALVGVVILFDRAGGCLRKLTDPASVHE